MKFLTCLLLLGTLPYLITPADQDTDGFETDLSLGLNLARGNSETTALNLGAETRRVREPHEFSASADYHYGQSSTRDEDGSKVTDTNLDNIEVNLQYNYLFTERTYGLVAADYLRDEIAEIEYRLIAGPGIGHYLLRDENQRLAVEIGLSYLIQEVQDEQDDYFTARLAQRYELDLNENARIWQSLEFIPELADVENYLLNAEIGARARLNGALSLQCVLQNRYDNSPADGKKRNDLQITAGISYSL